MEFFVQVNLEPDRSDRGGVAVIRLPHFFDTLVNEIGITPIGLMTVAPLDIDPSVAFDLIHVTQGQLIEAFSGLRYLSMGMSNDFEAAIMAGATHLRIGSSILGSRHQRA